MKSHPGPAIFHVMPEGGPLRGIFRSGVKEYYNIIFRQKWQIEIVPVIGGVILNIIPVCHSFKPVIRFVNKIDVSEIVFGGIKSNDFENRLGICTLRI